MPTYDELVAAAAAIRKTLDEGAEQMLRAIPGVIHVSVGAKERGNGVTRELCIRVYVKEKRPLAEVPEAERIPSRIAGIPTDVNIVRSFQFTEDTTRYRPVKGGIMISNKIIAAKGGDAVLAVGTFGCTATRRSDQSAVLLSNWHVLMANSARIGDFIFQPGPSTIAGTPPPPQPIYPGEDDDMIAKIVGFAITDKVDAAIARIDVSSCCHCCGVDYANEINGLSENGTPASNRLVGLRRAVPTKTVFKVGSRTGRTEGLIVDLDTPLPDYNLDGTTHTFTGQMTIASVDDQKVFAWGGDSGAVIVDEDGYIVGLLFGATRDTSPAHRAYANHIADVCTALDIDINLTMTQDTAGPRLAVPRATFAEVREGPELYAAIRERMRSDPAGAWLWGLGDAHREEVVSLVTRHRPVTVAWHRAGGPALFAKAIAAWRAGDERLPMPAPGGTLEDALVRVGDALAAHGSAPLREAIAAHRDLLLHAVRDSATIHDVLGKLGAELAAPR